MYIKINELKSMFWFYIGMEFQVEFVLFDKLLLSG